MAKVGKLHVHELPYNRNLPVREDVYACFCGKEFFVEETTETSFSKNPKKWVELDSSSHMVEYDRTVNGEQFIGRATKETVFDEEVFDEQAQVSEADSGGAVPEGTEESSGTTV